MQNPNVVKNKLVKLEMENARLKAANKKLRAQLAGSKSTTEKKATKKVVKKASKKVTAK